jgi:hypothetical protein
MPFGISSHTAHGRYAHHDLLDRLETPTQFGHFASQSDDLSIAVRKWNSGGALRRVTPMHRTSVAARWRGAEFTTENCVIGIHQISNKAVR